MPNKYHTLQICCVGVNHSTSSVAIRERLAIGQSRLNEGLAVLRQYVECGVILSTCNRTEVYATSDKDGQFLEESLVNFLNEFTSVSFADLLPHIYLKKNASACGHLFRVASGLDSMIIGEYEVLGQISTSLEAAEKADMINLPLRNLFNQSLSTGRRVREETMISQSAVSVSSVAVELAKEVLGDLTGRVIAVIGAGEAGRLVAKAARDRGASGLIIYNRSREKAHLMADSLGADMIVDDITEALVEGDVAVSCTSAPHLVISSEQVRQATEIRKGRPLVLIDIAVPRDIDPQVRTIENVALYNIDDLNDICSINRNKRQSESIKAMNIIGAEAEKFVEWWDTLEIKPIVSALIQKAEDIRRKQLEMTLRKLPPMSEKQQECLESMTKAIVTKVLHDPIDYLKDDAQNKKEYSRMVSEIFRLDKEKV